MNETKKQTKPQAPLFTIPDLHKRSTLLKTLYEDEDKFPMWFGKFEDKLRGDYFVGDHMTVADLKIYNFVRFVNSRYEASLMRGASLSKIPMDYVKKWPKLARFKERMDRVPAIAEFQKQFEAKAKKFFDSRKESAIFEWKLAPQKGSSLACVDAFLYQLQ